MVFFSILLILFRIWRMFVFSNFIFIVYNNTNDNVITDIVSIKETVDGNSIGNSTYLTVKWVDWIDFVIQLNHFIVELISWILIKYFLKFEYALGYINFKTWDYQMRDPCYGAAQTACPAGIHRSSTCPPPPLLPHPTSFPHLPRPPLHVS